ncbi:chemotaxis protein CheB [Paraburkholderia sacchari]|uniref:protein-glutamate methylesterase n=1 Tax=Paraburkholderia sacchari TaxID=159450 RepID=A0A8T6Z7V7_9BURK|nr:chemotaxis protein CheB [Paraburkholderia sacchari]NLP60284.1 chemotaxis protein CheB [Paraburkholderia sacchari]
MTCRDFIAIGASSGGVDVLRKLVSQLPADLCAAIAIVQHVGAYPSILPKLLDDAGPLCAAHAADGEPFVHGRIYVAPPDRHMLVECGHVRLDAGPKRNFARPAIDPLFESAATELGTRVVGVILTGFLMDGMTGLAAVRACGGVTIVQDPADAPAPDMPARAIPYADYVLPIAQLAGRLEALTRGGTCAV